MLLAPGQLAETGVWIAEQKQILLENLAIIDATEQNYKNKLKTLKEMAEMADALDQLISEIPDEE
jgi:flagellar biosynthesis/type III secretory pathway chaperone